ncbi:DUF454 domain-containing protein [Pelagivirga sediminicola]|uniref:DUF454 domain-containing protein n=1 Tax=Pelagivirga sediminicola TaxID=2170575 RepID=A0A2T7GAI0_9RHOB|nr:DUF454 domain-containing protein [Pelagivirga sediminicola]
MRALWICVGAISLALGAIGVILPLLPTTPFILLAAFAFARSAPRLRARLAASRVFGPIIDDWEAHGVIAPRYKMMACGAMVLVLLGSVLGGLAWRLIGIQALFMSGAAIYVLSRPSGKK